jgi:hypothetical protein
MPAPEFKKIGPVPDAIVDRTIEHLCPTVAAMVRLQRVSAMRPDELDIIRARDLNMSGDIWEYRPDVWTTEHHDQDRVITLGPRAQEIIRPFLTLDISGYLFSPQRALAEQTAERRAERKTPLWASHGEHQAKKRELEAGARSRTGTTSTPTAGRSPARARRRSLISNWMGSPGRN